MHTRDRERYKELCELAEVENDPKKLRKVARQIDRILDIEVGRLKNRQKPAPGNRAVRASSKLRLSVPG